MTTKMALGLFLLSQLRTKAQYIGFELNLERTLTATFGSYKENRTDTFVKFLATLMLTTREMIVIWISSSAENSYSFPYWSLQWNSSLLGTEANLFNAQHVYIST